MTRGLRITSNLHEATRNLDEPTKDLSKFTTNLDQQTKGLHILMQRVKKVK